LETLGTGSFSQVKTGIDLSDQKKYAVKIFKLTTKEALSKDQKGGVFFLKNF
jgi:serine/threonine protein kinase